MKIALVYDWVVTTGGAERILVALHELFPNAPLFTAVYNPQTAPWADSFKVIPSFLQNIPFASTHHELFATVTPFAFESFNFDSFDVVISITSSDAKGIITKPETLHICYCLTPTRYLWSHYETYFENPLLKTIGKPFVNMLRKWDTVAATRPDSYVSISKTVQNRIEQLYHRKSHLIYPPVDLSVFKPPAKQKLGDFFLIVSRLVKYKKVDLVIEACNRLKLNLVVIGEGRAKSALERIAGPTISFKSGLTDLELVSYYQMCRGVICPQEEDFGLVAVEALACGTPVVGYEKGGIGEIVKNGETGVLFNEQRVEILVEILKSFKKEDYSAKNCYTSVLQFDTRRFKEKFERLVETQYKAMSSLRRQGSRNNFIL